MATEAPTAPAKPTETINVKGMSDRWKAAQAAGGIPPAKPAEALKEPEPPKPAEPAAPTPAEPVAKGVPEAPKPKPAEPVKAEPAKPDAPPKVPSDNFKALEASRDEFRKKAEAAEARAKEIEAKLSTAIDPKQIKELESKLETAQKAAEKNQEFVDRFYLEHSESFKKAYADKIDAAIDEAKEAVPSEVSEQIEKVLRRSPSKARDEEIAKLTEEMSDFQRLEVMGSYKELKRLQREREAELSKSKENVQKLKEYEAEQAKARDSEFHKRRVSAYTSELASFEQGVDAFKEIDGNNEYNAIVKANRERAESFLSANSPVDEARKALWASYGYHAKALNAAQQDRIAKLEKQLADLQGANPSLRGGATALPTGEKPKGDEKPGERTANKYREAMEKGIPTKE